MAYDFRDSFKDEVHKAIKLLEDYYNLAEHDQVDCEYDTLTWTQTYYCGSRKYLASILSLAFMGVLAVLGVRGMKEPGDDKLL